MPPEPGVRGWLRPDWSAPAGVRALMSTRRARPAANGEDFDPGRDGLSAAAAANRAHLAAELGARPVWLRQVHGAAVARIDRWTGPDAPVADAAVSTTPGLACVVLAADCLPVLLCDDEGRGVAAAHAGWRGLAAGVLARTVAALCDAASCDPQQLQAWLGPCIGPRRFEVGADVLLAFGTDPDDPAPPHFVRRDRPDGSRRWLADLPALARQRLRQAGVHRSSGGHWCTVEDASAFFSFRRDGAVGRMAAAIARVG
jgi:YfiH family protein